VVEVEQMTLDLGHLMGLVVLVVAGQGRQQTEIPAQSTQAVVVAGQEILATPVVTAALALLSLKYLTT
jgi:hypothetical protein